MRHAIYGSTALAASVAILVKEAAFDTDKIKKAYIDELGANPGAFIAYDLWYDANNKCPAELAKVHLKNVLFSVKQMGIKTILIADANYFKYLTKQTKPASNFLGYAVPSKIEDYEDEFTVFYVPNYQAAKYNPKTAQEMQRALDHFRPYLAGNYTEPGTNVINSAKYPKSLEAIKDALEWLHTKDVLAVDIETRSLKFWEAGLETIAFAWDRHNGIAFCIDRDNTEKACKAVRKMLKEFFTLYSGKLIWHNLGYDGKVLVHELWMNDLQDIVGMIEGIKIMTKSFDDTKIIAYLATNNAVSNELGLKSLSAEYMGNYGVL